MATTNLQSSLTREEALALLKTYNRDTFHIRHALTVEGVMRWYAKELGYADEEEFWGQVGLLHDIDFEMYPEEHCTKAPELLRKGGVSEEMIHAICSHGYGICCDVEPEVEMEKVLFAADELTDLVLRSDASIEKHKGHGSQKFEKKVQGQTFCRRMFP